MLDLRGGGRLSPIDLWQRSVISKSLITRDPGILLSIPSYWYQPHPSWIARYQVHSQNFEIEHQPSLGSAVNRRLKSYFQSAEDRSLRYFLLADLIKFTTVAQRL